MPVSRILCITAATLGLHTATTSPNPPLVDAGRAIAPTGLEFMLASQHLRKIQRMLYWCIAMAETVVIAAQLGPQSALSQRLLTALAFGGHLGDVRFTMTPSLALGSLLIAGGAILRLQCYHALGRHFTFETGIFKNHVLVTTGPYSIVRHPSYTGAFLAFAGLLIYYGSPGSWVMECLIKGSRAGKVFVALYSLVMFLVVTGLTWRIPKEDEGLRNEFGKEWDTWAATVQYVLIPGIY